MKYFAFASRSGTAPDAHDAAAAYAAHFEAILPMIPDSIPAFREYCTLHDARLLRMTIKADQREAALTFRAKRIHDDEEIVCTLRYTQLVRVEALGWEEQSTDNPRGFGNAEYDEFDMLPSGALEHRLLFGTGIELVLIFGAFAAEEEPAPPIMHPK